MADTSNLSNYLTDIADAIRTKKETTEQIPAEQFDQEILSIETGGADTSDATATANDILSKKTAYIADGKTEGNIFTVYNKIINPRALTILDGHSIMDIRLDYNLAVLINSGKTELAVCKYNTTDITEVLCTLSGLTNIQMACIGNYGKDLCVTYGTGNTTTLKIYNIPSLEVVYTETFTDGYRTMVDIVENPKHIGVYGVFAYGQQSVELDMYFYTRLATRILQHEDSTITTLHSTPFVEIPNGIKAYQSTYGTLVDTRTIWSKDGSHLVGAGIFNKHDGSGYYNSCYKLSMDLTKWEKISLGRAFTEYFPLDKEGWYIKGGSQVYNMNTGVSFWLPGRTEQYTYSIDSVLEWGAYDNKVYKPSSNNILTTYTIDFENKTVKEETESLTMGSTSSYTSNWNNLVLHKLSNIDGVYCPPKNIYYGAVLTDDVVSMTRFDKTYINTDEGNCTETDMSKGKIAYVNGNKVIGSLQEYTSSSSSSFQSTAFDRFSLYSNSETFSAFFKTNIDVLLRKNAKIIVSGIKNSVAAPQLGITASKIAKGNTILGVNGTALPIDTYNEMDIPEYTVENPGTYKFVLNSDGYYASNNNGVKSSYAKCKVTFTLPKAMDIILECINYAESSYDYGLISNVDTSLSNTIDDTINVFKSFKGKSSASPVNVTIPNVPEGQHFIEIKYRKDSSGDNGNDNFQFKVLGTITRSVTGAVVQTVNDLSTLSLSTGAIALVLENEKLYKYDGTNWIEKPSGSGDGPITQAEYDEALKTAKEIKGDITVEQFKELSASTLNYINTATPNTNEIQYMTDYYSDMDKDGHSQSSLMVTEYDTHAHIVIEFLKSQYGNYAAIQVAYRDDMTTDEQSLAYYSKEMAEQGINMKLNGMPSGENVVETGWYYTAGMGIDAVPATEENIRFFLNRFGTATNLNTSYKIKVDGTFRDMTDEELNKALDIFNSVFQLYLQGGNE